MLSQNQQRPLLPILLVSLLATQGLTLFLVAVQGFSLSRLHRKPVPSQVQLDTGRTITTRTVPANERTDLTIKRFTTQILTQLLTLNGTITTADGKKIRDPGIVINPDGDTSKKVTTASATAAFALSADFRQPFLEQLAKLTPSGVYNNGQQKVVLVIDQVSEPQKLIADAAAPKLASGILPPGKWQLTVLANLTVFDGRNSPIKTIPFNREVVVETTSVPTLPEGDSPLEQAIYSIRQAGLQITDIRPISR